MRARTGRSSARCPTCSGTSCRSTRSRAAARGAVRGASASRARRPDRAGRCGRHRASSRRCGGTPDKAPFRSPIDDFYLTNPIARASAVMAECSALARGARADGGGVGRMAEFWSDLSLAADHHRGAEPCCCSSLLLICDRLPPLCRPQDLGGGAAPARPERGRPVGPAAVLRRPAEVRAEGADRSRPAPTRACSCWRRWSPACWRSPPGR